MQAMIEIRTHDPGVRAIELYAQERAAFVTGRYLFLYLLNV
jgi:hypothetical protein